MRNNAMTRRRWIGMTLAATAALAVGSVYAEPAPPAARPRVVLVWSEGTAPKSVYPNDINAAVAEGLTGMNGWTVRTAGIGDPEQGLGEKALEDVDALVWWGHTRHGQIPDATVERIVGRVREGKMGFIALHSAHEAKSLRALFGGTTGRWSGGAANDGKPNRVRVAAPDHPIARGIAEFVIPREERYEGTLDAPPPATLVFDGTYEGTGRVGPQGMTWHVGKGRIFYFRPGHETYPVYFQPEVRRVLQNAVRWSGGDEAAIPKESAPAAAKPHDK